MLGVDDPLLDEAVARLAVLVAVVLEAAHPGLVADGAVERVVDQEILHDHPLVLFDLGLLVTRTVPSLAGVWQPGTSLGTILISPVLASFCADLDLAHPAVGDDRERGVPAVVRDIDPGELAPPGWR